MRFHPKPRRDCREGARMDACGQVLCPLTAFGPMNEKNRNLMELAGLAGKLN